MVYVLHFLLKCFDYLQQNRECNKIFIFTFTLDATVLEEIWESGKRTQKESRKGSNGTAKTWWWVQRGEDSPSLLISWLVNVLLMFKLSSASSYWSVFQFNAFVYITRHRRIPCRRRQSASCFLTVHVHCQNYS